jgi:Rieske Fe-S protein
VSIASGFAVSNLVSCASVAVYKTVADGNKILVPLSLFTQQTFQIIRAKNVEYNIALRKESENNFTALLMRCTHADAGLQNTGNGFSCSAHGSSFDQNGDVKKGPATMALKKYKSAVVDDQVVIYLS